MAASHAVYAVYDKSGSMGSYVNAINLELQRWEERARASHVALRFVPFSNSAAICDRAANMPGMGGSTNIEAAFAMLCRVMAAEDGGEERATIVFISDGGDDTPTTIHRRLVSLFERRQKPRAREVALFAVAVGDDFPTGTFVDALRMWIAEADRTLPLLFPVRRAQTQDVRAAFDDLAAVVFDTSHAALPPVVLTEATPTKELERYAAEALHDLVLGAMARGSTAERTLALVAKAREAADAVDAILRSRVSLTEAPLASTRLRGNDARAVRGAITDVRTKAKEIETAAETGRLQAAASDADKARALVFGRHVARAATLRPADFAEVARSVEVALALPFADVDDALVDSIHLFSQREALEDARTVLPALMACHDVSELLSVLPLIGRAVTVRTCDGTQINPYLHAVTGVTHVVRYMTVADLMDRYGGEYAGRTDADGECEERANCLVLPASSMQATAAGVALANLMLMKTVATHDVRAVPALMAGYATHLLTRPEAWARAELEDAAESFKRVPFFGKYAAAWRQDPAGAGALGPEACEHLNKWLLAALQVACRERDREGGREGRELALAFLAEAVRRSKLGAFDEHPAFACAPRAVRELLDSVPVDVDALRPCDALADYVKRLAAAATGSTTTVEVASLGIRLLGLSEEGALLALRHLGMHDAPLTPEDRLEILGRALLEPGADAAERANRACASRLNREALAAAPAHVAAAYEAHAVRAHAGAVMLFPASWAARYERERGLEAGAVWERFEVNAETLLSRNACTAPGCAHFLRVLGVPLSAGARPRIRDALMAHMEASKPTPSFTRGVRAAFERLEGGERADADAMTRVVEDVANGVYLRPCDRSGGDATLRRALVAYPPSIANAEAVFDAYERCEADDGYAAWAEAIDDAEEQ